MSFIKIFFPNWLLKFIRPIYHGCLAKAASIYYGNPSAKLIVIGVTGTNGKSTTVNLIAKILQEAGYKVGFSSTVTINIDGTEQLNKVKMTMPSGWVLNKWLNQMVKRGCGYAILEVSSEGLAQNRHLGINFDVAVFTNLTPEHIEAHGGYENYKQAKARLFAAVGKAKIKNIHGQQVLKTIVSNFDDEHGKFYGKFPANKCLSYGLKAPVDFLAVDPYYSPKGVGFKLSSFNFQLQLKGQFDVYNALAAIATASSQHISLEICKAALSKVVVVPGRVEVVINSAITAVVDYAYEPEEMKQLYETLSRWPKGKVIQVLGPCGGGRDKARIKILGKMAGQFAGLVFITTDDPYDDDPEAIAQEMLEGVISSGIKSWNVFICLDRRQAIARALFSAETNDLVLVTGKGADQKMALANGKYIDWDDRQVLKEEWNLLNREMNGS